MLTAAAYPSLGAILKQVVVAGSEGTVGVTNSVVQLVDTATGQSAVLANAAPATTAGIPTTLDAGIQGQAERAVASASGHSGLVVLQASTGHILAIASGPSTEKWATTAETPGSTMKVIVAAALLRSGLTPDSPAPCKSSYLVKNSGRPAFKNDRDDDTNLAANLEWDLAKSCNTAFVEAGMNLPSAAVTEEASSAFGLTKQWDIGLKVPHLYATISPPTDRKTLSESMIGLGGQTVSPLAMASIAATVATGTFHQPVLLPNVAGKAVAA